MNWEAIGAVGEIVGAAAVVLSLIYLATQIRQNTAVARSNTRHGITESAMIGGHLLADNETLAGLLLRHGQEGDLSPAENARLMAVGYMTTRNWENIHYQYLSGMLTPEEWGAFRENLRVLFQHSVWREYWGREREIYTQAFRDEVDTILGEIDAGRRAGEKSALFDEPGVSLTIESVDEDAHS